MNFTTFNDMLRRTAWRLPDKPFLFWSDKQRELTYAQGEEQSDRVAGALAALGVTKGDRVGILAHNGLDYVLAMFGAWKLGAISAHISVLQADNLASFVNDCTPKVLIYTGDLHTTVADHRPQMPDVAAYVCFDHGDNQTHRWADLLDAAGQPPTTEVFANDPAHLAYTSGSTGRPKGAVLAHGFTARATHCIAERLGLSSADVSLGPTSLASSYHLVANLLPGIHRGVTIGLMSRWDAAAAWEEMERRGVTLLPANPLLLTDLLHVSRERKRMPHALRVCVSGGAPVPPDLKQAYQEEFGVSLAESYGQSELGGFVALGYPKAEPEARVGAIGPALPDKEVQIVDEQSCEVPVGTPGEMVIRGGTMLGYWQMPEQTVAVLRNDWLHTGDMGQMDSEGYITMLGRWSERIVTRDAVIFPRLMEEALYRHPAVRYAAVIGKPDGEGEVPKAVVALYPGKFATSNDLLAYCRLQPDLAHLPAEVEIIPEMPMTATGKIGRAELQRRERERS